MEKTVSAGGVIFRKRLDTPQVLLIRHVDFDDWFLPKGHVEGSEDLTQAATREIQEETGLTDLVVREYLGEFTRITDDKKEEKTEHYFLIELLNNVPHKISLENSDWQYGWFKEEDLPIFYIKGQEEIVRKAFSLIP